MAPFYQRPENALKRAEELVAVNQNGSALDLLHDVIMSKRSRTTPLTALEPIMLKFIELSVLLRKGKTAKEGLHQYKNISQNVTISTIELVIKRFIDLSEQKVSEAQAKADKINLDAVEDLEAMETPESIILSTVSGDASKDRTDREVVTPWLKFLWEAYRTALDILRNNSRLEILYQTVANQAFKFCLKYERKTEFRRLCELLRQHVTTAAKYSHQAHAINLNDPDTLQRHLDTRFDQLNAAAELELWQEGFRSIEDIHNLLSIAKKPPKPFMMANYYEKLARIFMVGENYLFHAAAWSRYYATVRLNRNLPEEEHQRMASIVLLSALSIPIITTSKSRSMYADSDESKPRMQRLANLLRVGKAPSREDLLKDALNRTVLSRVRPELRELYNMLEVDFHPLSLTERTAPILSAIIENRDMKKYARPLQEVILTRLLQQLSQVYVTLDISTVVSLANFSSLPADFNISEHTIENFIMDGCRKGDLSMRMNHLTRSITFETSLFGGSKGSASEGPKLQSLPTENLRLHLSDFASRLFSAVTTVDKTRVEDGKSRMLHAIRSAIEHADEERKKALARRLLIEKKKELRENEAARKAREEERERVLRMQKEAEAEKLRVEEEAKARDRERLEAYRAEVEKEQAIALAKSLADEMKVKAEDLENLGTRDLQQKKLELLEQERMELSRKTATLRKRIDHTARAFRKSEIPYWEADYVEQKKLDLTYHAALSSAKLEAAQEKHREDLKVKQRFERMAGDFNQYREQLEARRSEERTRLEAEAASKLAAAKEARLAEFRRRKQDEIARVEREEQERAIREEAERKRMEEMEAQAAAKAILDEQRRLEEAERRKKLDEQAARQREKEALAEQKIAASKMAAPEPVADNRWKPSGDGVAWRPREQPRSSAPEERTRRDGEEQRPAPPSDKYVPPSHRGAGLASRDGGRDFGNRDSRDSGRPFGREPPAAGGQSTDGGGAWRRGGAPSDRPSDKSGDRSGDNHGGSASSTSRPTGSKYVPPSRR